jgi:hypothetical protein
MILIYTIHSCYPYIFSIYKCFIYFPHHRCPVFDIVVGYVWLNDPESYASGSVATGRASHARQVKDDVPD